MANKLKGNTMQIIRSTLCLLFIVALAGCQTSPKLLESPKVKLTNVTLLPSDGLAQKFAITLAVTNPNPVGFKAQGMSYNVAIDGVSLLDGVSADLPKFKAYAEQSVTLNASTNLLGTFRLVQKWINAPSKTLPYQLNGKLDLGSDSSPLKFSEKGAVPLN